MNNRQKKSVIDIAFLLNTEIENNKQKGLKTSILFMDIKSVFDYISKNCLLEICKRFQLLINLIT